MKKITFLMALFGLCSLGWGQEAFWQSLNPGAGGRVQALSCDPTVPGRMFYASDVEGFYFSDDYGESWEFGDPNRTLPASLTQLARGRGQNFYVAHALGLSFSQNGGQSFDLVEDTKNIIISPIEIDPSNSQRVYAATGIQENGFTARLYPWTGFKKLDEGGQDHYNDSIPREIYYTTNGGNSWTKSTWSSTQDEPTVYSIQVDPTNSNDIVISTADGVYRSSDGASSWSKINGPSGIDREDCWGADFTPDGNWLYAIYRKGNINRVYVRSYPSGSWQDVGVGPWFGIDPTNSSREVYMWRPQVFEGSTANEHHVIFGQLSQNPANKLIEGKFNVSGDTVSQGEYSVIFGYVDGRDVVNGGVTYDIGWNPYNSGVRNNTYYPAAWQGLPGNTYSRGVFTMSQQSFFKGDAADGNENWETVHTGYTKNIGGQNFHRSRGAASTFTYDVAAYKNYMIQGQADNGVLESWDGGQSWRQTIMFQDPDGLTDAHGIEIIEKPDGGRIVLVSAAEGFGGGRRNEGAFFLWKDLDLSGPDGTNDGFTTIKGAASSPKDSLGNFIQPLKPGTPQFFGLPNNRIWQFHQDPNDLKRLYVGTESGLWVCDDFFDLINGGDTKFRDINGSDIDNSGNVVTTNNFVEGFTFDASDSNIIYYQTASGVWRGIRGGTDYSWTIMTRGGPIGTGLQTNKLKVGGVASVEKGGNVYTYTYNEENGLVRTSNDPNQFNVVALSAQQAISLVGTPAWWQDFTDPEAQEVQIADIVAVGDVLYVPLQKWEQHKVGLGFVRGTVQNNGDVVWEDWSADVEYPVVRQMKYYEDANGTGKIIMATRGAGAVARKTNGQRGDARPAFRDDIVLPQPPEEFAIFLDNFQAEQILWTGIDSDSTDVQTSASTLSSSEGTTSQFVLGLTKSTPASRAALQVNFRPINATGGTLSLDIRSILANTPAFNIKLLDQFGGQVDIKDTPGYNGNLISVGTGFQTVEIVLEDTRANPAFNPAEFKGIQFEFFGDTENDRFYIDNIFISGDNIAYSTTPQPSVEEVIVNPDTLTLVEGETFTITDITVLPSNFPNKNTVVSTNSSLNVSVNGKVLTANASGTATITVASQATPSVFDTIEVTVIEPAGGVVTIPNGTYKLQNKSSGKFLRSTNANGNSNLRADNTGDGDNVKWTKSDAGDDYLFLASDDFASGRKVYARLDLNSNVRQFTSSDTSDQAQWIATDTGDGDGSVFLTNRANEYQMRPSSGTATNIVSGAADNGELNKWFFVPADGGSNPVSVTGVSLSPTSVTLDIGDTQNLSVAVVPTNADNQNVSYSSSNTAVATVNGSGVVTAVAAGSATVTVTTVDGGFTDSTSVTVNGGGNPPTGGNGDCSATSPAGKPSPPCEVRVQVLSPTSVRLFWTDNSDNEDLFDIQQFRTGDQYRGGGLPNAAANNTSIDITDIVTPPGEPTTYKWRIKAVSNSLGGSVWVETDLVDLSGASSLKGSLEDIEATRIMLYPNPTKTSLYILNPKKAGSYAIFDLTGRLVKKGPLNETRNETKVDVSNLRTGMYSVRVADKNFKMVIDR